MTVTAWPLPALLERLARYDDPQYFPPELVGFLRDVHDGQF